jgi:hypothetical protein
MTIVTDGGVDYRYFGFALLLLPKPEPRHRKHPSRRIESNERSAAEAEGGDADTFKVNYGEVGMPYYCFKMFM